MFQRLNLSTEEIKRNVQQPRLDFISISFKLHLSADAKNLRTSSDRFFFHQEN